ncbi:glycosyltransferase 87 family protein [Streptomyces sp. GD-15H]|uniref:glycosyltransferase 87 family protein n=1 Tax=Streptomyces sp. GD-15H TaxID=3129112 RepID=UPI0032450C06
MTAVITGEGVQAGRGGSGGDSGSRGRFGGRAGLVLAVMLGVAFLKLGWHATTSYVLQPQLAEYFLVDLDIYLDATRDMLAGSPLYDADPPFNYPPFAAYLFIPFAVVPEWLAAVVWYVGKMMCLQLLLWWYLGRRGTAFRRRLTLAAVGAVLLSLVFDALQHDFSAGQVNLLLMGLVLWDLFRDPEGTGKAARWRGVGTGLAAAVKVVPALFIVHLFLTRQYRTAAVATGTFLTTVAIGFATLPQVAWRYWTEVLWASERVHEHPSNVLNQSLRGVVTRAAGLDSDLLWLTTAALVTVAALALAVGLHRRGLTLEALCAIGVVIPMITPLAWTHHWVWVLPATLLVYTWARGSWARIGVAAVVTLLLHGKLYFLANIGVEDDDLWTHVGSLELGPAQQLLASSVVAGGLVLLAMGALALRSARRIAAPPAPLTAPGEEGVRPL